MRPLQNPTPLKAALRVVWAALIFGLLILQAGAAGAWQLYLGGTDLTGPAAPVQSGDVPTVNVTLLGPALGLSVQVMNGELFIVNRKGMTWHGENNALNLEGQGSQIALDTPLRLNGNSAYLPVSILAGLAEVGLTVDKANEKIWLSDAQHPSPEPASPSTESIPSSEGGEGNANPATSEDASRSTFGARPSRPSFTETGTTLTPDSSGLTSGQNVNIVDPSMQSGGGWQPLLVKKSAEELSDSLPDASTDAPLGRGKSNDITPPAASDALRLGLGLGYVQGADYGFNLSATGGVSGLEVRADTLLTQGRQGLQYYNGRLSVGDRKRTWGIDVGDLPTEIWGARRGFRFSFRPSANRQPSISMYLPGGTARHSGLAFSYADGIRLGRNASLSGELTSTGSYLMRSQFQSGSRLSLFGYTRGGNQTEYGLLGSYRLGGQTTLYGSLTKSLERGSGYSQNTFGLRIPLKKGIDFTLENSLTQTASDRSSVQSAMLGAPLGPFRIYTRYDWGGRRISLGETFGLFPEVRSRNWSAILMFPTGSRLHLDYQMRKTWSGNNSGQTWDQMMASYRLTPKTSLQVIMGFPDLGNPDQLHFRLNREINKDLSLNVDYGHLSPYQSGAISDPGRGFSFLLSKRWNVGTPVRGGTLQGRALDQQGSPVPNLLIRCGPYSTTTDKEGRYRLKDVPADIYEVYLDEGSLPANYQMKEERRQVRIRTKKKLMIDFTVIPLSTVSGTVYEDRNGNGKADPGEGFKGAVVGLSGFVTATDGKGAYAFYNVEPGPHQVELDAIHLPPSYVPVGQTRSDVEMKPNVPVGGVDFGVKYQDREVIFQSLEGSAPPAQERGNRP